MKKRSHVSRPIITFLAWLHYITAFMHSRHIRRRIPHVILQVRTTAAASNNSTLSNSIEKPKRSAFGKAAIGKSRNIKSDKSFINSSLIDTSKTFTPPTPINSTLLLQPSYDSSLENKYKSDHHLIDSNMETRRQQAIDALKTHLSMSKRESLAFLDACPKLYTEIPNLSSKLTYLLEDINIKAKQLRRMIQLHPNLMETVFLDDEDNIQSTVEILESELDMSPQDVKMLESQSLPAILNYPRSELRKRILVYKLDLKFETLELKTLVLKDPRVLRTDSTNVRRILQVLYEELDINIDNVHTMLRKERLLLTYRAEENIRPTILYLKQGDIGQCLGMVERKGVSTLTCDNDKEKQGLIEKRLKSLIMGHPKILSSSVEKNLIPTVDFFLSYVGMTELELGRLIYRRGGSVLEANVERSLRRKIDFFRQKLDLELNPFDVDFGNGTEPITTSQHPIPVPDVHSMATLSTIEKKRLLAQMLATNPDILTLSIESNLAPKFEYLTQRIGFTRAQLCHILLKRPQLLALSLDRNIIPKMECFMAPRLEMDKNGGLGLTPEQLRDWMTECPQTLTCQLESRIRPRIRDAVNLNLYLGKDLPPNFITQSSRSWNAIVQRNENLSI